jgi:hypothetical protein
MTAIQEMEMAAWVTVLESSQVGIAQEVLTQLLILEMNSEETATSQVQKYEMTATPSMEMGVRIHELLRQDIHVW